MKDPIPLCADCGEVVNPETFEGCICPVQCGHFGCGEMVEPIHPNECENCGNHFCNPNDHLTCVIYDKPPSRYLCWACATKPNTGEQ